ncbi:MAG TPA: DUF1800 domain-containing protein [Oculatellaceae cyanobacterium]|jgi:uncharacterized protein (DUF1800 family)
MSKKSKSWVLSICLGLFLWLNLITPSYAAKASTDAQIIHVLDRLTYGSRPGDIAKVKSMGVKAYIQSQLNPDSIPQPSSLTEQLNRLELLQLTPVELRREYEQHQPRQRRQNPNPKSVLPAPQWLRMLLEQAVDGRMLRAIYSPRQVQEVMVDFWYNHFNVYSANALTRLWLGSYDEQVIRPHALGKFRTLLGATAKHPAMLAYLNNWLNTAPGSKGVRGNFKGLNENYARELLELHTLGVDGGYTQQDVIALARILTGWGFTPAPRQPGTNADTDRTVGNFYFDPDRHDFDDKVFLGQTIKGTGIDEGEKALDILARHPATARHISYQLAQYFIADQPPVALVDRLAQRFLQTDGDIKLVLDTLFNSSEFFNPEYYKVKLKTPYQYVMSAIRATGTKINNFRKIDGTLRQMGMALYGCETPNGYKNTEQAWLNPDAMIRRISFAKSFAEGRLGGEKLTDAQQLINTLGNNLSPKTKSVIDSSDRKLRVALILGSPEFMRH